MKVTFNFDFGTALTDGEVNVAQRRKNGKAKNLTLERNYFIPLVPFDREG